MKYTTDPDDTGEMKTQALNTHMQIKLMSRCVLF